MASLKSIAEKYLEPGDSLSEVLFGLVMTLTFTLGAGVLVRESPDAWRELLVATVGCNLAWGIIDAAMYIGGQLFERGRRLRLAYAIQRASSDEQALAVVAGELDGLLDPIASSEERVALYRRVVANVRSSGPPAARITLADVYGAFLSFALVFLSSIPAALPFLFIDEAHRALRVSNALLIAMLFVVGYRWAAYTPAPGWLVGLALVLAGVGLVVIAVLLGG